MAARRAAARFYRIIETMARIDLYFKVEVELGPGEDPKRLAAEIERNIERVYNVRRAEMSNMVSRTDD
jgi:hypothetical protein